MFGPGDEEDEVVEIDSGNEAEPVTEEVLDADEAVEPAVEEAVEADI